MVSGDKSRSCRTQMEAGGRRSLDAPGLRSKMLHEHLEAKAKSLELNMKHPGSDCFKLDDKGFN